MTEKKTEAAEASETKKKPGPKPKTKKERILEMVEGMSEDELEELRNDGWDIPAKGSHEVVWGVYCAICKDLAAEILGKDFLHSDGERREYPPDIVSIPKLRFQSADPNFSVVNRFVCQKCSSPIRQVGKGRLRAKDVVHIAKWREKREESDARVREARRKSRLDDGVTSDETVVNPHGESVTLQGPSRDTFSDPEFIKERQEYADITDQFEVMKSFKRMLGVNVRD